MYLYMCCYNTSCTLTSLPALLRECLQNDQYGVNLNNSFSQIKYNLSCVCLNNSHYRQELPTTTGKFQAPPKAINYSLDIAKHNRIEWVRMYITSRT